MDKISGLIFGESSKKHFVKIDKSSIGVKSKSEEVEGCLLCM